MRSCFTRSEIEQLVEKNRRLVYFVIKRHFSPLPPGVDFEDLVSAGLEGLYEALLKCNNRLSSIKFAYQVIRFRVSKQFKLARKQARIKSLDEPDCLRWIESRPYGGHWASHLIEDNREDYQTELRHKTDEILSELTPREAAILWKYYAQEQTLEEIARQVGLTKQRIHQQKRLLLERVRERLNIKVAPEREHNHCSGETRARRQRHHPENSLERIGLRRSVIASLKAQGVSSVSQLVRLTSGGFLARFNGHLVRIVAETLLDNGLGLADGIDNTRRLCNSDGRRLSRLGQIKTAKAVKSA